MKQLHVGYVLKMFPRLSETFIMNELLELERQGLEMSVFSLLLPGDGRFHGRLSELKLTTRYVPTQKPELYWDAVHNLPDDLGISMERWPAAIDFLRRCSTPKDLEFLLRALMIAADVKQRGISHLHAHFATIATRMAAVVNILTDVPFSFTAHAKDIFRSTVDRKLFSELVDRSEFCITVSDFNREFICTQMPGVRTDKVRRLYNGIDLGFFSGRSDRSGTEIPHIVSVGRLVPKKGFDHLLHALQICRRQGMQFRATIAGGGEQMEALTSLRNELGLDSEVSLPGALSHEAVGELMRDADIMALPCLSDQDGNMDALPTVLLEALALDIPIVSTRLTGVPEIVGTDCGLLCEPGDDAAFAAAIDRLWESIRSGRHPAGVGRRRAEKLFDLSKNVSVLAELFSHSAVERISA